VAGAPPSFAVYLPLWFMVQYLGHVFAYLADRRKWSPVIGERQPVAVEQVPSLAAAVTKQ
jgi:hypothetical protein